MFRQSRPVERSTAAASTVAPSTAAAGRWLFWAAAVLGTLHAASSAYWALGGQLLLDTVGQWAIEAQQQRPTFAFWALMAIALVKLAAAWFPLLAEMGRLPGRRLWRAVSWVGGPALVLYGGADLVAGSAVLLGVVDVEVTDRTALIGHAFVWGPHFALWGLSLTIALVRSRNADHPTCGARANVSDARGS